MRSRYDDKPMPLMNLGEAMKNTNLLQGELGNISRHQEENITSLAGMLYSIPKAVTRNRTIHQIFDSTFEENDDDIDEMDETTEAGDEIRQKLEESENSSNTITIDSDSDSETDTKTDNNGKTYNYSSTKDNGNLQKGKNVDAETREIDNFVLPFIPVIFGEKTIDEYKASILPEEKKKNLVNMVYDFANKLNNNYAETIDPVDVEKSLNKMLNAMSSQGFIDQNTSLTKKNSNETAENAAPKELDNVELDTLLNAIEEEYGDNSSNDDDLQDNYDLLYNDDSLDGYDLLDNDNLLDNDDLLTDDLLDGYDFDSLLQILLSILDDYYFPLEDDDDEYEFDEYDENSITDEQQLEENGSLEGDENSTPDEQQSKENSSSKKEGDDITGNNKKEDEKKEEEEQNNLKGEAGELFDKAQMIAEGGAGYGSYGLATREGIQDLSEFFDEFLNYSSGILKRKNKPFKELVRNFNSMKAIESQLVGDEEYLRVVPTEDELKEVAESSSEDVTTSRAARLGMEQTYASKVLAINRFEYSDKLENLIRNALYDIYTDNKDSNDELKDKVIETGQILLPLLRTRQIPDNYNYNFQYDVLREIIRQEEFYNKSENNYGDDSIDMPTDNGGLISIFVFLRYLKTILNYNESIKGGDPNAYHLPESEKFKILLISNDPSKANIFNIVINSSDSEKKITNDELDTDDKDYNDNLTSFSTFVNSYKSKNGNNELKDSLIKINSIISKDYTKIKNLLSLNPTIKSIDNLASIKKLLTTMSNIIKNSTVSGGIKDLGGKIRYIADNIKNPTNLMEHCGQDKETFEQLKEALKKARTTKSASTDITI